MQQRTFVSETALMGNLDPRAAAAAAKFGSDAYFVGMGGQVDDHQEDCRAEDEAHIIRKFLLVIGGDSMTCISDGKGSGNQCVEDFGKDYGEGYGAEPRDPGYDGGTGDMGTGMSRMNKQAGLRDRVDDDGGGGDSEGDCRITADAAHWERVGFLLCVTGEGYDEKRMDAGYDDGGMNDMGNGMSSVGKQTCLRDVIGDDGGGSSSSEGNAGLTADAGPGEKHGFFVCILGGGLRREAQGRGLRRRLH